MAFIHQAPYEIFTQISIIAGIITYVK